MPTPLTEAAQVAERLANTVVQARVAATNERFTSVIEANSIATGDLTRQIDAFNAEMERLGATETPELIRTRNARNAAQNALNSLTQQNLTTDAALSGAVAPVRIAFAEPFGKVAPEPLKTGGLVGGAAAVIALVAVAAWPTKNE